MAWAIPVFPVTRDEARDATGIASAGMGTGPPPWVRCPSLPASLGAGVLPHPDRRAEEW